MGVHPLGFDPMISFVHFDINARDSEPDGSRPCPCHDSEQLHVTGMDDYVTKPIRVDALVEAFARAALRAEG
jgi:CheY-like chemotaxis protein